MALATYRTYSILAQTEGTFDSGVTNTTVVACWGMSKITGFCQFSAAPTLVQVAFSMDGVNWDSTYNIGADPSGANLYTWSLNIGSAKFVKVTLQANAGAGPTAHFNVLLHAPGAYS